MAEVIPLRPGLEKYRNENHVEFYAFCLGQSSKCKFAVMEKDDECAYAREQFLAKPLCVNRSAHMDALKKIVEGK